AAISNTAMSRVPMVQQLDIAGGDVARGSDVAFFTPDLTETPTIKRAQEFLEQGRGLNVFGFQRARYNRDYRPPWSCVVLGRTTDGNYPQRVLAMVRAIPIALFHGRKLHGARVFYARNIDQLLLAFLLRLLFSRKAAL